MKKLLLLPLVAIGLALVPAKQADAQVSVGVGGVGIGFGYPAYRYSYYGNPGYSGMAITRAATTAIMAVIHRTERLTTPDGRTTTATIGTTSIVKHYLSPLLKRRLV
jgi:hypothetical protein